MKFTNHIYALSLLATFGLPAMAQTDILDSVAFKAQTVDVGVGRTFTREESSASVSIVTEKDVNHRGARNIGNNLLGQGNGLVALDGAGSYQGANATFYVRGLQSLSSSTPLVMVDGIERSIQDVASEDVESVTILKDAAATAIYGYRGISGAILIKTKRGQFNTQSVTFSYDHGFGFLPNKPKMLDAYNYGKAVNEARANEGLGATYSDAVLQSYKNGTNPLYFPNVNWVDETMRSMSNIDKVNLSAKGGTNNFRYYTGINLVTNKGFIKNAFYNPEYSTQDKYTRATIRNNMDIDLGPKTKMHTNLFGVLTESSQPGDAANLWDMIYKVPANAFPVHLSNTVWGGDGTYTTNNPVAQSAAGFYKVHSRGLYSNLTLDQDLSSVTEGLSFSTQLAYDTFNDLYENHSKTYRYGYYTVSDYTGGVVDPANALPTYDGKDSALGTDSRSRDWVRRFVFNFALQYEKELGAHSIYSQLKWDWQYNDATGTNTTVYRQNYSWFTHYSYDNRYNADLSLIYTGSSRLAKGSKWGFSPTLAASWNLHNEEFMQDVDFVDFLKVRASAGLLQSDFLPLDADGNSVWTYYNQFYTMAGSTYPFYNYGSDFGNTYIAQAATQNLSRERAYKYNIGVDATLFGGLNVSVDYYIQNRRNIWVNTEGSYSSVFGLTAPYENFGKVNAHGFEIAADYSKQIGDLTLNVGGTFNLNKNTIKDQCEAPQLYENLVTTGLPLKQTFGYKALGFFKTADDTNSDGIISDSEMKAAGYANHTLATVRPGDVVYQDINNDGKIDANDKLAIGYSTTCPEIFYTFHLGAEYKGIGLHATLQGVGRYSGVMNTNGMFRSAVATNTLSQYMYDNRWTVENQGAGALFPRLSSTANANNDVTSTLNLFDRSYLKLRDIEVYYNLPSSLLETVGFVHGAKVYLRGTDLFTADHLSCGDAASYGAVMPLNRCVMIGASVTF